jgi:hypothetical protein
MVEVAINLWRRRMAVAVPLVPPLMATALCWAPLQEQTHQLTGHVSNGIAQLAVQDLRQRTEAP